MGTPAYDIAHLLGGGMLLVSFVLLYQRRIGAVINAFALQGALLAAAAAWQGYVQDAPGLYLTAAIAFAAKAVAIPLALRFLVGHLGLSRGVETPAGIGASLLAAIGLVGLSVMVVLPVTAGTATPVARVDLTIALSVVLLGMLAMIARRNAISQVIGLLSLENGLILGAVGVAGMPLVVELSTAALVFVLAIVAVVVVFQIRDSLDTLDTSILDRERGD
ncbi:hydrogenase-4 component E [Falsiroseomonas oryziterrae]|uniref:hydrogenase-4 component E n=1 Tax=Falsiroseomonas oryziterrae TaxID=2911368 RepID=UPI001F1657AE|nr:hydrogenase-4 component E [Roseomonas sp. NPKOSM-4]